MYLKFAFIFRPSESINRRNVLCRKNVYMCNNIWVNLKYMFNAFRCIGLKSSMVPKITPRFLCYLSEIQEWISRSGTERRSISEGVLKNSNMATSNSRLRPCGPVSIMCVSDNNQSKTRENGNIIQPIETEMNPIITRFLG